MPHAFILFTRAIVCMALTSVAAVAAPQEAEEKPPEKVQKIHDGLETLVGRVDKIQTRLRNALGQAKQAKSQEEQDALHQEVDEIGKLADALTAEVVALRIAVHPVKVQVTEALRLPTLKDALEALKQIDGALNDKDRAQDEDAMRLRGIASYQIADVTRQIAVQDMRGAPDPKRDEGTLGQAIKRYEAVLKCQDVAVREIGSSVHAAALRRIVQCQSVFYLAYVAIPRDQRTGAMQSTMRRSKKAAIAAFERLQRVYPDATLEDGQRVVDAAQQDVERLR